MKAWQEILDQHGISTDRRKASERRARQIVARMNLPELRRARRQTQQELSRVLGISQASVSEMERRADAYVSTLRRFVEALGGELQIVARFPQGDVIIDQFASDSELDPAPVSVEGSRNLAPAGS